MPWSRAEDALCFALHVVAAFANSLRFHILAFSSELEAVMTETNDSHGVRDETGIIVGRQGSLCTMWLRTMVRQILTFTAFMCA